jgi:hypothetical protein
MLLNKVESIEVSETAAGRILGYGTIVVIGTRALSPNGASSGLCHAARVMDNFAAGCQREIENLQ